MTVSPSPCPIEVLVDDLALMSTLCNATDLGVQAKMHGRIGELLRIIEARPDPEGVAEFRTFGSALETLLEGLVLHAYPDAEKALDTVRQSIAGIQSALRAAPDSVPLPSDKDLVEEVIELAGVGSASAEVPLAPSFSDRAPVVEGRAPSSAKDAVSTGDDSQPARAGTADDLQAPEGFKSEPLIINDDELEYVRSFVTEAYEHIDAIEAGVLALEQSLDDQAKINQLFRPYHTIKGMAGFLNLADILELAHRGEALLDLARKGRLALTPDHVDLIFNTVDILKAQVGSVAAYLDNPIGEPVPQPDITEILSRLSRATCLDTRSTAGETPKPNSASGEPAAGAATTRASGDGASFAAQAGAATPTEQDAPTVDRRSGQDRRGGEDRRQGPAHTGAKKDLTVRVDTAKLDHLVNMVGELVIAQAMVGQNPVLDQHERLAKDISQAAKITREVQEITMSLRMVTLRQTFQKMGRLVRDVARKGGKRVEFSFSGEDTELDKSVIEEIGDPLMHMVRNAVDHGVEPAAERAAAGKPEAGQVHLHAAHQGGNVIIEITDDGRGIDRDKLIARGIDRGLISETARLSDAEVFALTMQPGFSTAERVTDISGRGVGMDVVKRNIDKLHGKVEIWSKKGKGSRFTIRLPLTLAIIDGMIVTVENERFIIPTIAIDRSLKPRKDQVVTVQQRGEMLHVRGELCPLIRLDELFGIRSERRPVWEQMVVIVVVDGRRVGIVLDDLIGQQQIVIKALGDRFKRAEGISGAAILGDGRVGLILDTSGLVALHGNHRAA